MTSSPVLESFSLSGRRALITGSSTGIGLALARTRWMLGSKRRFVILRDQGRLFPKPGFLAQMSQTAATVHSDPFEGCLRQPRKSSRGLAPR